MRNQARWFVRAAPYVVRLSHSVRPFIVRRDGSIALWFGLVCPMLMLVSGMSVEYARYQQQSSQLLAAADAAAIAAAKELSLTDGKVNDLSSVAKAVVEQQMSAQQNASQMPGVNVTAEVATATLEVTVNANHSFSTYFGVVTKFLPSKVLARSVARVVGSPNICVLALEPSELGAVWLAKSARMTGDNCSVFSNSKSSVGIVVRDNANLTAKSVCSAGGVEGRGLINPEAVADCPQFDDPLASRAAPVNPGCMFNRVSLRNETATLTPGVYCGGLRIDGTSHITFEPGEYIIEGGLFWVGGTSTVEGENVSFYLGTSAWMHFGADTTVRLTAMKTGVMAGLLFFGSRSQSRIITHTILSKNAQRLVGTIYLPRNTFIVDGEAAVGGESAYTAIVARRVVLLAGPHLVLNSNYDQTDVPVPEGIRGATQPVRLVQ